MKKYNRKRKGMRIPLKEKRKMGKITVEEGEESKEWRCKRRKR